ncbi:NAD(P)-binding domain [Purpureocillium lavendulum]|uniref:NAD(P)-binding domain n=1 Tax=Purpureocillium lavendulum TaxID=1247861 RepID=A0AB34FHG4_9HYPO|nr:NAD(P)-binding domain [Purpureocillium lavendulum]
MHVNAVLEGLDLNELDEFRHVLASALHEFSTNTEADDAGVYQQPHRVTTYHPGTRATTLYMPSCGPEGMGCKVVSLTSSAATRDPSVKPISPTGVVNLFSPDGKPLGLVHASTLTAFRTALSSACLLNRRNHVKTVTVFGSGMQAYWHVRIALMMRGSTIKHVNVINRRFSESAAAILKRFTVIPQSVKEREGWSHTKFGILTPTFHEYDRLLKEQIRSSDVIYCCTPSREDLFDASILTSHEGRKKGRLIVAVGSYTPEMRELPEGLLVQATKSHDKHSRHFHKHAEESGVIVVDTLDGVLKEAGEIISAKIGPHQMVELGELVMLHRLAVEESESESGTTGSQTPVSADAESVEIGERTPSMSTVYSDPPRRGESPSGSRSPGHSRKPSFPLPFRTHSNSSSDTNEKKKEDSLARWLRDGTVIYKSVGLGLMDLVVGMHLVQVASEKKLDGAHAHASADAHGGVADLLAGALELVEQGGDLAGAGAAQGVTEGDGAALGVDLVVGDAELVGGPQALRGKGLVDLVDVDVVAVDAGEVEGLGDGLPGALAHEEGLDADDGGADVLADDGLAELLGGVTAHEEDGGGAVGDLAGVAGVDGAVGGKGRADLGEGLDGDAVADAVVAGDGDLLGLTRLGVLELDGEGGDLGVEEAGLLGLDGLLVRGGSEGVLVGAGDVEGLGHVLGQDAHGDLAVGCLGVRLKQLGELGDGGGAVLGGH